MNKLKYIKKKCFVCDEKVYNLDIEGICEKCAKGFLEAKIASVESAYSAPI